MVERFLGARGKVFEFHLRPFLTDHYGVTSAKVFSLLELLADLCGLEGEIGGKTEFAARLDDLEGFGSAGFIGNDDKNIGRCGKRGVEFFGGARGFVDKVPQDDIAHAEADGRQVDGSVAEALHEPIVATAASKSSEIFRTIKNLEDNPGVVGKPAHDREIG